MLDLLVNGRRLAGYSGVNGHSCRRSLSLLLVAAHKNHPRDEEQNVKQNIETKVRSETFAVARGIRCLKYLTIIYGQRARLIMINKDPPVAQLRFQHPMQ